MRQYQSAFFKMSSYRVIGSVTIDLRFVANKTESNVLILPLENCSDGSSLEITIQGEVIGEHDENDETMSINSDSSSGTLSSVLGFGSYSTPPSSAPPSSLSKTFGFGEYNASKYENQCVDGGLEDYAYDADDANASLDNSQGKASIGNSSVSGTTYHASSQSCLDCC